MAVFSTRTRVKNTNKELSVFLCVAMYHIHYSRYRYLTAGCVRSVILCVCFTASWLHNALIGTDHLFFGERCVFPGTWKLSSNYFFTWKISIFYSKFTKNSFFENCKVNISQVQILLFFLQIWRLIFFHKKGRRKTRWP